MLHKSPLLYIVFFLFLTILYLNITITTEQHFILLAKSFNSGSLALNQVPKNISDLALFEGKYYWPLGPFPAILLMPFVLIFQPFYQGFIAFVLTVFNFYLLYKISRILNLSPKKSLLLSTFFIFGSIYTPLAALPASWYFAQIVACTLLILAIYENLHQKRFLLIGLLVAFAVATRANLLLSSVFFLYYIFKNPRPATNLLKFIIPILATLTLLGAYNFQRFKTPFETGYNYQLIPDEPLARRNQGLFSIAHIPSNLFYMLVKGPDPVLTSPHQLKAPYLTFDSYGMSLFFLSPVLFLLIKANFKKEIVKVSLVTSLILAIPVITYYGIGQRQVGFRYALDFFPFIFLILADTIKKINGKIIYLLVFWGVFFSVYFSFLYYFGLYN